jgi:hypothetical protein
VRGANIEEVRALLLALTCGLTLAPERGADYWRAIARDGMAVPEGESAAGLLAEFDELFGARDAFLRDQLGYGIAEQWILRGRLLVPQEARALAATWTAWLGRGMGEQGTDTVLVRAFTALDLSLLAALDLEAPFLDDAGFAALLDGALDHLAHERDLRGWEPDLGWIHATAHTADLLKFLSRSPRLDEDGQARILEGIARRMTEPGPPVFVFDEDERLADAVLSVLARDDLSPDAFAAFLELCRTPLAAAGAPEFDAARFAARRNTRNLLRAVHERLLLARELPARLAGPRDDLREALRAYRTP